MSGDLTLVLEWGPGSCGGLLAMKAMTGHRPSNASFFDRADTPLGVGVDKPQVGGHGNARAVLDVLAVAVYVTDALGNITYYNNAAADLWGHRPQLGQAQWCGSWKLYWPDGSPLPHDQCPMAVALREGRPVRGLEAVAERPDGTRVPFIPYPTPLFGASGREVGAVNMLVDISDRREADRAAQRLSAIVESAEDAILAKDLNGVITNW